jgi:hypothetical protein
MTFHVKPGPPMKRPFLFAEPPKETNSMNLINAIKTFSKAVAETLYASYLTFAERWGLMLYAAHTSTETMTGTAYAISATLPATYDAAGYGLTTIVYTVIGGVISFTPYGSERDVQKVKPINGPVEKIKGQADYGDGDMQFIYLPADAGQIIVKAAEANMAQHYSLKITYPDGEIHYLDTIVAAYRYPAAKEAEPFLVTAKLGICKAPVIIAAP